MRKIYEKPSVEIVDFRIAESIMDGDNLPDINESLGGMDGWE